MKTLISGSATPKTSAAEHAQAGKQAKRTKTEASIASSATIAKASAAEIPLSGIGSLPEHLFVDILALLQSHEIAQAARVCKGWNLVASTPYLWSHLSFISSDTGCTDKYAFTTFKPSKDVQVPWQKIVERAKGRVLSVELGYISHHNITKLAGVLLKNKAARTLKHITWSIPAIWVRVAPAVMRGAAEKVMELAQACAQLASLEVMSQHYALPEPLADGSLQNCKLRRFRTDTTIAPETYTHLSRMLSCAKVVSIFPSQCLRTTHIKEAWLLELLGPNSVLEELTGEYYSDKHGDTSGITTSLALRKLELCKPWRVVDHKVRLHAPNLRELAMDVRLLCKLSTDSFSQLSSLSVLVKDAERDELQNSPPAPTILGPTWKDGFKHIAGYTGPLTLEIGGIEWMSFVLEVLRALAHGEFAWPGLTQVRVFLQIAEQDSVLRALVSARKAGAQGASQEQYEAIAQERATASGMTFNGPSLCQDVVWHIHRSERLSGGTIGWLRTQDNVHLHETSRLR